MRPVVRACIFLFILAAFPVSAAPVKELWPDLAGFDEMSKESVDHAIWDAFLRKYVKDDPNKLNRVDYSGVSETDRKNLERYIETLTDLRVTTLSRQDQLPYWINLYNALTVKVILDHYPVKSIRDIDISPGLFSSGPWGKKLVTIEDHPVSLDDIEHRLLRPIWNDPRIHYAVNCASVGCPDLIAKAYTSDNTDHLLSENAARYINSDRGVKIEGGEIVVSKIYDWFQEDFGGAEKGVIQHLLKYATGPRKAALGKAKDIDGYIYDWSLNGLE
ncbi:MAG: DUF547 domain-containing protein [Rhodospirillales bacterium]|nr:DUF547 domain-containing protein [Rhodospirillales bacterium]